MQLMREYNTRQDERMWHSRWQRSNNVAKHKLTIMSANHSHQHTANSVLCQDGDTHNITARRVSMSCRRWITFTRLCAPSARSGTHTSLSCWVPQAVCRDEQVAQTQQIIFCSCMHACLPRLLACLLACELQSFHFECVCERTKSMWAGEGLACAHNGRGRRAPATSCHKSEITQPTVEEIFYG